MTSAAEPLKAEATYWTMLQLMDFTFLDTLHKAQFLEINGLWQLLFKKRGQGHRLGFGV